MTAQSRLVGIIAAALGFGIAGYAIGKYEAWWTIVFAVAGAAIALAAVERRPMASIVIGIGVGGSIVCCLIGLFLVYMGITYGGAACLPGECPDQGPVIALSGVALVAAGLIGLLLTARFAGRSARRGAQPTPAPRGTDPAA